jgi:hypothetical protein
MKFLIVLFFLIGIAQGVERNWQKIGERKGISSYRAEIPGSKLVGVKGDAIINGPAERVLGVLVDDEHLKEWVDRLKVSQVLEKSGPKEDIMYQEYSLPWPLKNRDFVFRGAIFRDLEGRVHLTVKSIDHPLAPPTTGVRGEVIEGEYIITPLGKSQCRLEVEVISDPKGAIPKWVVNIIQKEWPFETITAIKNQLEKPYTKDIPLPEISI